MSLMFKPEPTYKLSPKMSEESLDRARILLDTIDLYNSLGDDEADRRRTSNVAYKPFPQLPLPLTIAATTIPSTTESSSDTKPEPEDPSTQNTTSEFKILSTTTGKDLVSALGEPGRKGGGGGPSGGSIAIWCDWPKHGIMIEFGGLDARGPKAWENGKDAQWAIMSLYKPDSS